MGTKSRGAHTPLSEELYERPARFEFFQAVRLLRKLHQEKSSVGRDHDPDLEMVRFRSDLSYAFPTGDIRTLRRGGWEDDEPPELAEGERPPPDEMEVNFLGIATQNSFGSLPVAYVEEIRRQERDKNFAMREFFDLFNHRLVSLFYRAWERSRLEVLHDLGENNPFESALEAFVGIEGDELSKRLPLDSQGLLGRSGLLAMRPAPVVAIEGLIASMFGVSACVEQFIPTWYEIDDADRTRLGQTNAVLGESLNIGSEVCLMQWRFRIELGPMDFDSYQHLLPDGDTFTSLCSVIRLAMGPEYDFEFRFVLAGDAVPALRLCDSTTLEDARTSRLGWTSWLTSAPLDRDARDAVFTPSLALEEERACLETTP